MKVNITVNGVDYARDIEPRTLLAYFLREECGLTGTHVGCDTSSCGCCVVVMDDEKAVKACTMFAVQADGHAITTVEGLAQGGALHPIQQAFWDQHGLQCGYCTPGMMLTSFVLLNRIPIRAKPTSARASRGTSVAAPGIRTSSKPCSRRPKPCGSRRRRASEDGEQP
jgi:carbon-monoxide dehydrogenase small subunit